MTVPSALGQSQTASEAFDVSLAEKALDRETMTPRQGLLYDYWLASGGENREMTISDFDPLEVWGVMGYLHIVQYDSARDDFFYRVYGEAAARAAKAALHRRWVTDHPGKGGAKLRDHYLEIKATRRPWLGEAFIFDISDVAPYWNRLALPLSVRDDPNAFACITLAEPSNRPPENSEFAAMSAVGARALASFFKTRSGIRPGPRRLTN